MKRATIADLAAEPFDILVIGGGIYGMMTAREAALRGLRVALVERADFGGATSHNSLKVMHGGIRYVQHLDPGRLRASARERAFWQAAAPQLVHPMEFIIPLFGHGVRGPAAFAAAAALYTVASAGLRGPGYGGTGVVSARTACARLGDLAPAGLTGGGVWRDGQIEDINRLHMSVLRSAFDAGAILSNHVEAVALTREGDAITGARMRGVFTGDEGTVRAGVTVCCSGAATARLADGAIPGAARRFPGFARATNLVIDRPAEATAKGVVSRGRSDAIVDRGGRMFFLTPWQGRTIIGTHESPAPDATARDPVDIRHFLAEISEAAPALALAAQDVLWVHQGLIPADVDDGPNRVRRMTRGTLIDHAEADGVGGLISVVGVKYTTARLIAERAITRAGRQLDTQPADPAVSFRTSLPEVAPALVDTGSDRVLEARMRDAFEKEMAMTLADAIIRRTNLAECGDLDDCDSVLKDRVLRAAAKVQAWDDRRVAQERDTLDRALSEAAPMNGRHPGIVKK
ncbi:FAD-dependent oxidoreductase [Roseovarius sp. D22-M7]|uniref:FAD-dependent oxidoreductase n=1 Tax=Roseovarius sp. D22-M7 TaxID=3127116 RepID=UPI00300FD51D